MSDVNSLVPHIRDNDLFKAGYITEVSILIPAQQPSLLVELCYLETCFKGEQ